MLNLSSLRRRRHECVVLATHPSGVALTLCPDCAEAVAFATLSRMPESHPTLCEEGAEHSCADCGAEWFSGEGWRAAEKSWNERIRGSVDSAGWLTSPVCGPWRPATVADLRARDAHAAEGIEWQPIYGAGASYVAL